MKLLTPHLVGKYVKHGGSNMAPDLARTPANGIATAVAAKAS